ncbi:MAG: hypothetical protein HC886_03740 [Leptolyngbyaceae cyanobacterium SM1_1_3]|nr:hypothetical protein [Leptolyngbyaceae cyanobacterium SM1_1_3]NJN03618.1 hypothetical protein [Leptolyngbyaceae cyanobacterium RM1_1_2]NJO11350.1 hypothetical protein [Leptolyngbyaceae cyanobacterium SL_1_1]
MLGGQAQESHDEYISNLLNFSNKAMQQGVKHTLPRPAGLPTCSDSVATPTLQAAYLTALDSHADPLAPLRYRDLVALNELFDDEQILEIEADILQHLSWMYPEPCWDDEPYSFLQGYI